MSTEEENIHHLKNKYLREKFGSIYEHAHHHNIQKFYSWFKHLFVSNDYDAIVDTRSVETPDYSQMTSGERLNRATYSLWKIYNFNPNFFNYSEQKTIAPRQPKVLTHVFYQTMTLSIAGYVTWNALLLKFPPKAIAVTLSLLFLRDGLLYGYENVNDKLFRMPKRKRLAKEYMQIIGEEKLVSMAHPNYPITELKQLQNKKYQILGSGSHVDEDHG